MRPFVLLIEDEAEFAETLRAAFELRNITLDIASTWDDGRALFQICAHELVIADYQLPGSDNGFALLAAAKQHRPGTMLVLISGVLSSRASEILDGSDIIDAYYAKEPDLLDKLLIHVERARDRAPVAPDWPRIAANWLRRNRATPEEIAELDARLREQLGA
jgi:two-component system, OmpR family, response regulator